MVKGVSQGFAQPLSILFGYYKAPLWLGIPYYVLPRILKPTIRFMLLGLFVSLAMPLGFAFSDIRNRLEYLANKPDNDMLCVELQKGHALFRRLRCAVASIDGVFSVINLAVSLLEILVWLAYGAALLVPFRSDARWDCRRTEAEKVQWAALSTALLSMAIVAVFTFTIRLTSCIFCHEQALSVKTTLLYIRPKIADSAKEELEQFLESLRALIDHKIPVFTAFGYLDFTKQYITMVTGILATYCVILYQNRQSQTEIGDILDYIRNFTTSG
ncbi:uncharacterized protein LOC129595391 [Paramacrobiotus metropolitanus]|uniref:uncharacterized protein LOC129595391 n=1 Tax=Paramacrobiotus metropolitanus TaxID=2943436 RepID=UPI002445D513|nr:uncharacterized protein LOC129595391 [Paramacrobiotus metropolitanus]